MIAKCETQQRPIPEPSPKSFFLDQTCCPLASGRLLGFFEHLMPWFRFFQQNKNREFRV
jgi:hypothetical protein